MVFKLNTLIFMVGIILKNDNLFFFVTFLLLFSFICNNVLILLSFLLGLGFRQQKSVQIGKIASSKFWDRQTSLEREDLELGASVSQTNNDAKNASNALSATEDQADASLNINKKVPPLINVCC